MAHSFGLLSELIELQLAFRRWGRCCSCRPTAISFFVQPSLDSLVGIRRNLHYSVVQVWFPGRFDCSTMADHTLGDFDDVELDSVDGVLCLLVLDTVHLCLESRSIILKFFLALCT